VFHKRNTLFHARSFTLTNLLGQLYRLQTRIRFVHDREKRRDTVPPDLVEVDREYKEKVQAVAALKGRLTEAELEKRKAEGELADHKEKLKKYQAQLRNVQSSREYSAALNEIDGVEKAIRSTEDRFLELEEEIEKVRADLDEREKTLPTETDRHEERLKDWRAEQRTINEELASAREEIARLEAEIPPRDRAEFHRLVDKKHGLALVLVQGSSCSACHVKVRPAAMQILKQGREVIYCDSCKRILYYEPQSS
jgi:predicted  nucleic acid-binding Zn-ribbon protein